MCLIVAFEATESGCDLGGITGYITMRAKMSLNWFGIDWYAC